MENEVSELSTIVDQILEKPQHDCKNYTHVSIEEIQLLIMVLYRKDFSQKEISQIVNKKGFQKVKLRLCRGVVIRYKVIINQPS